MTQGCLLGSILSIILVAVDSFWSILEIRKKVPVSIHELLTRLRMSNIEKEAYYFYSFESSLVQKFQSNENRKMY